MEKTTKSIRNLVFSKGKSTKSLTTFRKNKANLSEVKFGLKHFSTRIYERFHPLPKRKNKPNQTQYKPNSNPITERPKMNVKNAITMNYIKFLCLTGQKNKAKTNPKQTQFQKSLIIPVMCGRELPILDGFVNLIKSANILLSCSHNKEI